MRKNAIWMVLCALLWITAPAWAEEEAPPPDAKSLCEILQGLEKAGYANVSEAAYDDGRWKIEAYRDGERRILQVNARSGAVETEREDDDD